MLDKAGYDQVIAQSVDKDEPSSQRLPPAVGVEVPPGALHRHLDHHARQTCLFNGYNGIQMSFRWSARLL
jgi:hypothetical protein